MTHNQVQGTDKKSLLKSRLVAVTKDTFGSKPLKHKHIRVKYPLKNVNLIEGKQLTVPEPTLEEWKAMINIMLPPNHVIIALPPISLYTESGILIGEQETQRNVVRDLCDGFLVCNVSEKNYSDPLNVQIGDRVEISTDEYNHSPTYYILNEILEEETAMAAYWNVGGYVYNFKIFPLESIKFKYLGTQTA
jgi:hypothetical protein